LYENYNSEELKFLATIYGFVIQNLTQHIHRTSWYFRNYSQPSMDISRHCKYQLQPINSFYL